MMPQIPLKFRKIKTSMQKKEDTATFVSTNHTNPSPDPLSILQKIISKFDTISPMLGLQELQKTLEEYMALQTGTLKEKDNQILVLEKELGLLQVKDKFQLGTLKTAENECTALSGKIETLQSKSDCSAAQTKKLLAIQEENEKELLAVVSRQNFEILILKETKAGLERANNQIARAFSISQGQCSIHQAEIVKLKDDKSALGEKIRAIVTKNSEQALRMLSLEVSIKEKDEATTLLKETLGILNIKLNGYRDNLSDANIDLGIVRMEKKRVLVSQSALEVINFAYEDKNKTLSASCEKIQTQLVAVTNTKRNLAHSCAELRTQLKEVQEQKNDLEQQVAELKNRGRDMSERMVQVANSWAEQVEPKRQLRAGVHGEPLFSHIRGQHINRN